MFFKPVADPKLRAQTAALEAVQANIMIADPDLRITYVNPAAMALMQAAEAEMVKQLPRFSTKTLVGSNIDVFHKQPDHHRTMLARLDARHSATIEVGPHTFDLQVTPLAGEAGERIGFVVEWSDATYRLQNLDYAAQIAAIGRSQASIQFDTDGTIVDANTKFLELMEYTLAEIKGRHHSIFMLPEEVTSPEYRQFWDRLRSGSYQAGQFGRSTKSGRRVWIEGAYNPILDQNDRVTKIIKFATDISGQKSLQASLNVALEKIDHVSSVETGMASAATEETSTHVQSAAASAEQLAASTQEIARSMGKSQKAAEDVDAQASAVASSTDEMAAAAQAMNGIVGLIRSIASQINLLALNSTIEAARAGDAGKGFAVVASEVKNLAIQAAKATEQITSEIDGLQTISADVSRAIGGIRESVGTVRDQVTLTASAVEEQTAVTLGVSTSMQAASMAMASVSASVGNIANAVREVSSAVAKTKEAARMDAG